ncbi:hypothetical protein FI667_g17707, partial [Globisporangium splendens]
MLHDRKRKRSLQCVAVVPPRSRNAASADANSDANATTEAPPVRTPHHTSTAQVRAVLATSHFLAVSPRFTDASAWYERRARSMIVGPVDMAARSSSSSSTALVSSAAPATTTASEAHGVDVRKVIGHARRARRILMDRLTMVNLRRMHRCELVDEIERLKKVLAGLQEQIDTTVRNVETMDRLVQHLQKISNIFTEATAGVGNGAETGAVENKEDGVKLLEAAGNAETASQDEEECKEKEETTAQAQEDKSEEEACNKVESAIDKRRRDQGG